MARLGSQLAELMSSIVFERTPDAGMRGRPALFTRDEALKIQYRALVLGESIKAIAEDLDVSAVTISRYVRGGTYGLLVEPAEHKDSGRHGGRVSASRSTKRGEPMRMLLSALAERPHTRESPCWLEWPYTKMMYDRPALTLPKHPITGKRWTGPVVKVAWWKIHGDWPMELAHWCQRTECWNPGHTYEPHRRENQADYWRLANFVAEHGADVQQLLRVIPEDAFVEEARRRGLLPPA